MASITADEAWSKLQAFGPSHGQGGMQMSGNRFNDSSDMWAAEAEVEADKGRSSSLLERGRGIDTVFLLDCSESLGATGFERMKDTFYAILESIKGASFYHTREENVAVVTFGESTKVECHLTNNYDKARFSVGSRTYGGRSPLLGGLYMALAAIAGRGSTTVINGFRKDSRIILLSDGKPTDSEECYGPDVLRSSTPQYLDSVTDSIIQMATRLGAELHDITCIPVGDADEDFLTRIAQASSGRFVPQEEAFRIGRYFKNLTTLTRMKRTSSLYVNDRQKFSCTVAGIDSDANDWDIDDMLQILKDTSNLADIKEDEDEILNPNMPLPGIRVRRGPHWKWGDQDGNGPGTIVKHTVDIGWVMVEWDYTRQTGNYRYGVDGCYDLELTREPRILHDELIASGCMVTRGPDWHYGAQDGGSGEVGIVFEVNPNGIVRVRWPNGHINIYRFGSEGQFDLQIWQPEEKMSVQETTNQQHTTSHDDFTSIKRVGSLEENSSFGSYGSDSSKVSEQLHMTQSLPFLQSEDDLFASGPEDNRSSAVPQPQKTSGIYLWQYKHGDEWKNFQTDDQEKIEQEQSIKRRSVVLQDKNFRVCFEKMNMFNANTKEEVPIRKYEVPTEISGMETKEVDLYFDAMESGTGQSRNIRLMIVGHEGVGKTTMCHNLLQRGNIDAIQSTNGIDIFIHRYEVNLSLRQTKELHCTEEEISRNKICDVLASWKIGTDVPQSEEDSLSMQSNISYEAVGSEQISMTKDLGASRQMSRENADPQDQDAQLTKDVNSSYSIAKFGKSNLKSMNRNQVNTTNSSRRHDFKTKMEDFDFVNDIKDVIQKLPENKSQEENEKAYLSVWDFGGEEVFYDTHHIFLSTDAIYLVVFNVKECQGHKQKIERVQFWLRSIGTLGSGESNMVNIPPIILIGTHIDMVEGPEEEKKKAFTNVCKEILTPNDLQGIKNFVHRYIYVDNTNKCHTGFTELWDGIAETAPRQSQWEKMLPAKWLALERDLLKLKSQGHNIMTFGEVVERAKKCEAPITKEDEIEVLLKYLNMTGNILFFDDKRNFQEGKIVLNPQWIVNAFKFLITAAKFVDFDNKSMELFWEMYHTNAELTLPLVDALWKENQFRDHKSVLLNLMEEMGLVARPLRLDTTHNEHFTHYIVPTILKQSGCEWLKPILEEPSTIATRTLCFVFNFIPFTIFHKLMAMCIAQYKNAKDQLREDCLQKDFGCFMVDSQWFMALTYKNSVVKVTMFKFVDGNEPIPDEICVRTREFLGKALHKILDIHHLKNVRFKYAIHCDFQHRYNQKLVSVEELMYVSEEHKKLLCCKNPKLHFMYIKDLRPWFTERELYDMQTEN